MGVRSGALALMQWRPLTKPLLYAQPQKSSGCGPSWGTGSAGLSPVWMGARGPGGHMSPLGRFSSEVLSTESQWRKEGSVGREEPSGRAGGRRGQSSEDRGQGWMK